MRIPTTALPFSIPNCSLWFHVDYTPPGPDKLPQIWHDVQTKVEKLIAENKPELASAEAFCQMSRSQFFFDCNKRTAWLMSLGILVDAG